MMIQPTGGAASTLRQASDNDDTSASASSVGSGDDGTQSDGGGLFSDTELSSLESGGVIRQGNIITMRRGGAMKVKKDAAVVKLHDGEVVIPKPTRDGKVTHSSVRPIKDGHLLTHSYDDGSVEERFLPNVVITRQSQGKSMAKGGKVQTVKLGKKHKSFKIRRGALHRALGIPEGETIGQTRMRKALKSKSPSIRKMARSGLGLSAMK